MTETGACGKPASWWDGEYERECQMEPPGHPGDHFDGVSWYDDDGNDTTAENLARQGLVVDPEHGHGQVMVRRTADGG